MELDRLRWFRKVLCWWNLEDLWKNDYLAMVFWQDEVLQDSWSATERDGSYCHWWWNTKTRWRLFSSLWGGLVHTPKCKYRNLKWIYPRRTLGFKHKKVPGSRLFIRGFSKHWEFTSLEQTNQRMVAFLWPDQIFNSKNFNSCAKRNCKAVVDRLYKSCDKSTGANWR